MTNMFSEMYKVRLRWMRDRRADDGVLIQGWRKVGVGGVVKFDRRTFQHDNLIAKEGNFIFITWDAFWMANAIVYMSKHDSLRLNEITAEPAQLGPQQGEQSENK